MEKITNIEIKNFKSIRHQKIDGCKRINVFVGKPNVGKSNILEALSLFSIDNLNQGFSDLIRIDTLTTVFFNGEISIPTEIKINDNRRYVGKYIENLIFFTEELERERNAFQLIDEKQKKNKHTSIDVLDFQSLKTSKIFSRSSFQLVSKEDKITIEKSEFNYGGNKFNNVSVTKYDFNKNVKYINNNDISQLISPNGSNIFSILSNNQNLRKEITAIFKLNNLNFSFDKTAQEFKILKFVDDEIVLIPYALIADTLQRLIFYKAAIFSNSKKVLLLEEPESHMYPPYISKLTSDIIYDKNDNQYFIATHSPYVLNDFMEDAKDELSIYLVDFKDGETVVYKLDDEEMHIAYQFGHDFFMNIENFIPHTAHEKV